MIRTADHADRLPDGELRVQPLWPVPMKDTLVGVALDEKFRPAIKICGAVGFTLVLIGAVLMGGRPM